MKFSLVLSTVERTEEVRRFLESLVAQTGIDAQLIVVDQNEDDRLTPILGAYKDRLSILHLKSARGLSRARNVGLRHATGDVVAFPDDDCWYPQGLLAMVQTFFQRHPYLDGITGRFTDAAGISEGRWLPHDTDLNRYNVWRGAISFSIFLRRRLIESVDGFNEKLGVGAGTPWGAAEETDYLLRSIRSGFRLRYLAELVLGHPVKAGLFDANARERQQRYEAGIGRVIRMNGYPVWYFPVVCARTCGGACLALIRGDVDRARFKIAALKGRLFGWRGVTA